MLYRRMSHSSNDHYNQDALIFMLGLHSHSLTRPADEWTNICYLEYCVLNAHHQSVPLEQRQNSPTELITHLCHRYDESTPPDVT